MCGHPPGGIPEEGTWGKGEEEKITILDPDSIPSSPALLFASSGRLYKSVLIIPTHGVKGKRGKSRVWQS